MATGGTIPANRTQSITFYNTTGIIDREKNIYLAPRTSKYPSSIGHEIRDVFLTDLNSVCPPSSAYKNIGISQWSPQDRTLKVRGNIDDFRLITDEGDCLNYFILSRTVTKGEGQQAVTNTFYYGFFITNVEQAGGGSVLLTVEPDDFTNVFYLHNKHVVTQTDVENDYEPFNEKMKNCYVNRQHYDRVAKRVEEYFILSLRIDSISPLISASSVHVGDAIRMQFETEGLPEVEGEILDFIILSNSSLELEIKTDNEIEIGEPEQLSQMNIAGSVYVFDYSTQDIEWEHKVETEIFPANMKVFLNQEETFRYKYQYRDLKYPVSVYDGNFTDEEIEEIEGEDTFENLSANLREKILKACISFLVVETKSLEIALYYDYSYYSSEAHLDTGNKVTEKLNRPNVSIAFPFISIPEVFSKFNLRRYDLQFLFVNNIIVNSGGNLYDINKLYTALNKESVGEYIYSCYVVKDIAIPKDNISFDLEHYAIRFKINLPSISSSGVASIPNLDHYYLGGISYYPPSDADASHTPYKRILIQHTGGNIQAISCSAIVGLIYPNKSRDLKLTVRENIPNLKTNYYDNVLEAEPYSFYSISTYGNLEMAFNKNRYYEHLESTIELTYLFSVNGAFKAGYIPSYKVEGKQTKYFSEGLSFTLTNTLPIVSDSYSAYYYQNLAQMKNQYAVNNYQNGTDLLQRFFISAPNQVGLRASKAGGWGALAETGNQVMGMVDDAIDWAQSDKVIGMNQKAKLADMGAKPDALKQAGSDVFYDLSSLELNLFLNHYTIDNLSYNSIAKLFERTGYQVNLYDNINAMDRVGWNFIKLNAFDFVANITVAQESSIRKIFMQGVTLLHDKSYLTAGHNFETILEGGD